MAPTFDHTVDPNQATFIGFGLEGIAYGVNVVLFASAMVILLRKPAKSVSATPILAITCFMFSLVTVHYSLNFNNVYDGTMRHVHPIATETHLLAGADMLFVITDFCSQLILIYRCYLVWGKNIWVVILPLLVAFAAVSCGLALLGLVLSIDPTAPQAPAAIVPVGDAAFAMSLILNFFSSALIVGRIWWMSRQARRIHGGESIAHSRTSVRDAIGIIVESGLLFLAAQFVFVVLFAIAHPAQAVVEPIATQIYGTAPMLIIVRVGMGVAYEQTHPTSTTAMTSMRFNSHQARGAPHAAHTVQTQHSQDTEGPMELAHYKAEPESSKGTVVVPEFHAA